MIRKAIICIALAVGVMTQDISSEQRVMFQDMVKSQCGNRSDIVRKAGDNFVSCINALVDVEVLKKEIETAKPKGALDEVFKKYCDKSPQMKECINTGLTDLSPCFEASGKDTVATARTATSQLLDFICHKGGDRIALFIAEKGPECFQEKVNNVLECTNKRSETEKPATLNEQCGKYDEITECIVKALEGCDTPTPANMSEALFKFIRKTSPCKSVVKTKMT